ncbi:MAG: hypothetical protein MZV70_36230 [Desulfobacterales bacterium]|nr:hypothetical protein [Desulfobacterales bacterium]
MPRGKKNPVDVAAKMNEAPSATKGGKRTKTIVKTKEDGSVEITSKAEDDIPEIDVKQELKSTLLDIIKNPDKYDDALVGAATRELQRRGKLPDDYYSNENVRNRAFESLRQGRERPADEIEAMAEATPEERAAAKKPLPTVSGERTAGSVGG